MQLANRLNEIAESITLAVTAKANALKKAGVDVVSFGAGEPDFDTPSFIKEAAIKALQAGKTKYEPTSGTVEARKAIADYLNKDSGLHYAPEQIIVSVGGKHALYLAFQAVLEIRATKVITVRPRTKVSYPEMVKLAGGVPVIVKGDPKNNLKDHARATRPPAVRQDADVHHELAEQSGLATPTSQRNGCVELRTGTFSGCVGLLR